MIRWVLEVVDGVETLVPVEVVEPEPAPIVRDLEAERAGALVRIDRAAEQARLGFITPGYGQSLAYKAKEDEARRWLAMHATAPEPEPPAAQWPWLAAELGVTAETLHGVAVVIATVADQWIAAGSQIEAQRLGAKRAVELAATIEEIDAASAVSWPEL